MKIKELFDLNAASRMMQSGRNFSDAVAGSLLARSLTAVDPTVFEAQYPELAFVNANIRVDNSGGYARRIQSLRITGQGEFKVAGDRANDKGKISISGDDSLISVYGKEAFAEWSDSDIKEAELQGINLMQRLIAETNRIYLYEVDQAGFVGVEANKGILNTSLFTATGAGGAIGTLTGKQMYDAIAGLVNDQQAAVKNTTAFMANLVVLPTHVWSKIRITDYDSSASTPVTVLTRLQQNMPDVRFIQTQHADAAGGVGVSHTLALSTNPQALVMRIPEPLRYSEVVQTSGWTYREDFKYRIAGADILEPSCGRILTGL